MNKERQRIAIAEACGWDCDPVEARQWGSRGQWCKAPAGFRYTYPHKEGGLLSKNSFLPDYLNDLNAMHEAESTLANTTQQAIYDDKMFRVVHEQTKPNGVSTFDKIHSTAAQRAEAFLKTLDLWEGNDKL